MPIRVVSITCSLKTRPDTSKACEPTKQAPKRKGALIFREHTPCTITTFEVLCELEDDLSFKCFGKNSYEELQTFDDFFKFCSEQQGLYTFDLSANLIDDQGSIIQCIENKFETDQEVVAYISTNFCKKNPAEAIRLSS